MSVAVRAEVHRDLRRLTGFAERARSSPAPHASDLVSAKAVAWKRILLSLAKTEGLEQVMMEPLIRAFAGDPVVLEYLRAHARDEERHAGMLAEFVERAFSRAELAKRKSWTSRVLYGPVLARITSALERHPRAGIALIFAYEKFSLHFYRELRRIAAAEPDEGTRRALSELLESIEKDEHRHTAAMRLLLQEVPATPVGRLIVGAGLGFFWFDLILTPWALHNRDFMRHARELGFDIPAFNRALLDAIRPFR